MLTLALMLVGIGGQLGPTPPPPPPPPPAPAPKVESTDIKVGTGEAVELGDIVSVDYTGKLQNGKVFDTSKKPGGIPYSLVVGIGEVIKGWDQGLIGMKAGGIRKLKIPPALAYGDAGSPPTIPAHATLTFTVAVNKVDHAGKRLKVEVTKAGTGPALKLDDDAIAKMTCKSSDGKVFLTTQDSTPDGMPLRLGQSRFFPGLTLGLMGMKAGEKRTLTIPPELAFGPTGQPSLKVKPNETITIEIELVSIGTVQVTSGGKEKRQ